MTLQRIVPPQMLRAQANKLAQAGEMMVRQSRLSNLSLAIRQRFFQVDANQSLELSPAWMRGYLLIQNTSLNTIYLDFDKPASLVSFQLASGAIFNPQNIGPCMSINVFALVDSQGVIMEG